MNESENQNQNNDNVREDDKKPQGVLSNVGVRGFKSHPLHFTKYFLNGKVY